MIGQTVSHYRIIDELGEGGMGVVYLAEDTTLGRRVAMKFLSSTTNEYRARFLREARAVSALTHPNIATVYDYGETGEGQPYIVMELIKGESLSDKLRAGLLPLAEAVRIVSYIAEALGEAHHEGVVHRDIKPSNVVITERGQVKVLDFGLVKHIAEHAGFGGGSGQKTLPSTRTRSDVIVGTPLYLSPEQATGKAVDGRSDLFALGAVLYECITGQSAFAGASVIEIGAQVLYVTPAAPSRLNDRIPPELDRITMKAIEKRVEARYQSAAALIEDLRQVLPTLDADGYRKSRSTGPLATVRTHSATALTTITETLRRPRLSLGAFVIAIVALVLGGWGLAHWWKPSPYKPSPVALDWYNKGTDALRNGAFLQASKALQQAVLNDNRFAIAHARLAEAWTELEYADKAKDEMLRVQSLVPNRSQLATLDALYLEGINATVTRDYPGAVRAYAELVRLSPDDPKTYVDLGRAYEKNDEIKKAIESYVEATNRAPQYATAFLRVGILYGRQANMTSATATFDKADTLYQALGNYEGRAEVSYQRGFLFDQRANFTEARQHLQQALQLARTTGNEYQQVKTLQKLGDVEIDANNVAEGRQYMMEAIELSQAEGIDNLTKRGLIDLGNTFIADGNYSEAEKYFKQSLDLAKNQNDARNSARAWLALASMAERRGNSDEVLSYIDQSLPFYQQGGYRREILQALTLRARARVQKGDYDAALQAFEEELKLSQQFGDQAQAGLAHEDIGLLFIRQGKYPDALSHFEESYRIASALGTEKNIGLTLTDRANALWRLGRYDETRAVLGEASRIAERPDAAKNLSGPYYLAIARMALTERRLPEAASKSQKAFAIVGTQFKRAAIAATYTDGLTQVLLGNSRGRLTCEQALEMAKQLGDPTLLSEALLNLAQAQLQTGDPAQALKSALESQALFAKAGNRDNEWIAWLIAARSSRSNRDLQNAHDYAVRADMLLASIEQQWGSDNYGSYLKRPDIQLFRTQLNQLLADKT